MTAFSHKESAQRAIDTEVRRNKTMAINASNADFKLKHPDWVRDAQQKKFTQLEIRTKENMLAHQKLARDSRKRLGGQS